MTSVRSPDMADIIRQAIEDRLAEVHVMLPGRIDAYDADLQKADVEPLIKRLQETVDGELSEDLPVIPGVPVVFPRAGGFKITMPVQSGDRCMLVFCERSIDTYQTGQGRRGDDTTLIKQTDPGTFEMHNLSDPVCLLGWYNDAEALNPAPDADDMVIGEHGGPVIHIGSDQVNLYQKSGSGHDFVALAQKVLDELGVAKANAQAAADYTAGFITAFTGSVTLPNDGGASLKSTTLAATPLAPTLTDPSSVAAAKVKAT